MKHIVALKYRNVLHWLFNQSEPITLHVAIGKTYPALDCDEWTVYVFADHKNSTFLLDAARLLSIIADICTSCHASTGEYDAGTTETDIRTAITLH